MDSNYVLTTVDPVKPPAPYVGGKRQLAKLRVLSLFAGIGCMELDLERTGDFRTVAQCEIEPFQRAVLRKHWPNVQQYADIGTIDQFDCDVICGGFPCQPFSTASRGRRVALDLWPEMLRVVNASRPTYVIAENVNDRAIHKAADDLRDIRYTVTVRNISGHDCGAPHGRSRWWAVAHPHEEGEFQRALDAEVAKLPELCAGLWNAEAYAGAIRVSDGSAHRVHRVEALGNAVIPQIPQVIGQAILEARRAA